MNKSKNNEHINKSYLRDVFDVSIDAMVLLDKQGLILDCNEQFCVDVGKTNMELLGLSIWDITADEDIEERKSFIDEVVRTGEHKRVETLGKNGWLDLSIRTIGEDKIVIFARDITNYKKAESSEKVNEKRHKALAVLGQMYEADFDEILEYALESALEQTFSSGGYIAAVQNDNTIFLEVNKLKDEPIQIISNSVELDIDDYSNIQEVFSSKKPVTFSTETSLLPSSEGTAVVIASKGAIVPVMATGEIKLILGVYERNEPYTETDCIGLMHFMDGVWRLKERIDAENTITHLNNQLEKKVALRTAQLKESETRFRTAFESTANGMVIFSLDLDIIQVNKSFTDMLGYDEEELIGTNIASVTCEDEINLSIEAVASLLKGEEKRANLIKKYINKNGTYVIASVDFAVIKSEDGSPAYLVANVLNITEVERTRKERDRIFELSSDVIVICDFQGVVLYINSAIEKMLGYSVGSLINNRFSKVLKRLDARQAEVLFAKLASEDEIVNFESKHVLEDDSKIWISWYFTVDRSNNRVYGIGRNITSRKRYEKGLKEAKEQAEQADLAKSEFLANISHEIRTPLNAVIGFSELLSSRVLDSKALSYLSSIKASGKALLTLINDILDISKLESMELEPVLAPADLNIFIDDITKVFRHRIESKGLVLNCNIDESVPAAVLMDIARIRQVMLNLIGNAVKFTDTGAVTVSVSCEANGDEHVDLSISVKDTGVGIPEKEFKDIFLPFRQRVGQNVNKYGGTGLGLSISGKLIKMLGGHISVESKVGEGSIFTVFVPNILKSDRIVVDNDGLGVHVRFKPKRVLVVDDENSRGIIRELLENSGLFVMEAQNGLAAGLIASEVDPDLIILSDRLPDMTGAEAAKGIKNKLGADNIKILGLVSTIIDGEEKNYYDGVFVKPISAGKFIKKLEDFLEVDEHIIDEAYIIQSSDNDQLGSCILSIEMDNELSGMILKYNGVVDFAYLNAIVEMCRKKGLSSNNKNMLELADCLDHYIDNLEIENIRNVMRKLYNIATGA